MSKTSFLDILTWPAAFINRLLPAICLSCGGKPQQKCDICLACEQDLPWLQQPCHLCALPLQAYQTLSCGRCQQIPPPFDRLIAMFHYQPPIENMLTLLKFHGHLQYAKLLGTLFSKYLATLYRDQMQLPEVIIPIPLHRQRLQQRGFNQALLIAQPIARQFKIPLSRRDCHRKRATQAQTELTAAQRLVNVKNAFAIDKHFRPTSVAIVDDVVTTMQTVIELSKVLRENGVQKIDVWCVARTHT